MVTQLPSPGWIGETTAPKLCGAPALSADVPLHPAAPPVACALIVAALAPFVPWTNLACAHTAEGMMVCTIAQAARTGRTIPTGGALSPSACRFVYPQQPLDPTVRPEGRRRTVVAGDGAILHAQRATACDPGTGNDMRGATPPSAALAVLAADARATWVELLRGRTIRQRCATFDSR